MKPETFVEGPPLIPSPGPEYLIMVKDWVHDERDDNEGEAEEKRTSTHQEIEKTVGIN